MKTKIKPHIQIHVEGDGHDIFRALNKPELKNQYESFIGNNEPLFEDEPDYRVGSISVDSMPMLVKTIIALHGVAKKLCLYISGQNEDKSIYHSAWIGEAKPPYTTGAEITINESVLTDGIRKAAKDAYEILGDALMLRINEQP